MTSRVAGQRLRLAVGGETAFARLATRPCVGMLGSSSRASSPRVSFLPRKALGATAKGDPPPSRPSIPTRPLFTGAVPPLRPRAQEARGPPFTRAKPLLRPRVQAARGVVREVREKARAAEKAHTLAEESTADMRATPRLPVAPHPLPTSRKASPNVKPRELLPKSPLRQRAALMSQAGRYQPRGTRQRTAISQLSPAEIEEERRIAEAFNAFLDAFPAPPPKPAAPKPAPTTSTWKPQLPTVTPIGREAETLAAELTEQGKAGASAEAAEPDADLAPSVGANGEPSTVDNYPRYHKPSAATVLGRSPPPPPPPTAT